LDTYDDAGVYRLRDDLAVILTVDFFTPIVDDPYDFGRIAAANALSDVYAMGGRPLTAMNIICFPTTKLDISVLQETLKGGLNKIKESGALLVGGHSVEDEEFKYGLSVLGMVHPDRILTNKGAKPGDCLIITKPIGTGIINTAIKGNLVQKNLVDEVTRIMSTLNQAASEACQSFIISACTDVTGFGLLGHACEMIDHQTVGLMLDTKRIPLIPETLNFAKIGIVPGGARKNRDFRKAQIVGIEKSEPAMIDILFDPQTSGGLLIAVGPKQAEDLVGVLQKAGVKDAAVIGEFTDEPKGRIVLKG
jgi:selenide,water dikinase